MTVLLCDVGGTHIRFALSSDEPLLPQKMRVDQFANLGQAILAFLNKISVAPETIKSFYLAFSNRNTWDTTPATLNKYIPNARINQFNDFEANAHGVILAQAPDFKLLNQPVGGTVIDATKVVMGVGTGLGLAYILREQGNEFVQRTHGAHMLPAWTEEFSDLYKFIAGGKDEVVIYEDMLTGRGLYKIYEFLSARNHLFADYQNIEGLMNSGRDNPVFKEALKIFHKLLGVFCHQAVAFGYAYGGVYLTGGIIDRLMEASMFDIELFKRGFVQKNVPIVTRDVLSTPIYWITDEFISLKGLLYLAGKENA